MSRGLGRRDVLQWSREPGDGSPAEQARREAAWAPWHRDSLRLTDLLLQKCSDAVPLKETEVEETLKTGRQK